MEMNEYFVERNDQSSFNRFLTESMWSEEKLNHLRLKLLQDNGMQWKESGCISIDDVIEKTGKKIVGVGKLFNHSKGRYVNAQQLVTSHYVDSEKHYPIQFFQYFKGDSKEAKQYGFQSKIDLACKLVDDAIERGILSRVFLFDSWYLCKQLTEHIVSSRENKFSDFSSEFDKMVMRNEQVDKIFKQGYEYFWYGFFSIFQK